MKKRGIGISHLTEEIYYGVKEGNQFVGEINNITNDFLHVVLEKFEPNTICNITIDGVEKYRVLVIGIDSTVAVNGREV